MPKTTWTCTLTENEERHLNTVLGDPSIDNDEVIAYINSLISQAYELGLKSQGQPNQEQYITLLGKDSQGH